MALNLRLLACILIVVVLMGCNADIDLPQELPEDVPEPYEEIGPPTQVQEPVPGKGRFLKHIPEVEWVEDVIVQPVPEHASDVRLFLPVELDEIVFEKNGHFQGFGAHINDRIEGVEVAAFELKPGTIIRNMADGVVVSVTPGNDYMGYQVQIDYGDGLEGRHHYLKECIVEQDQELKRGDALGEGHSYMGSNPSLEFLLADSNRADGQVSEFSRGRAVSMFDYLEAEDQAVFIALFEEKIIEPYIKKGESTNSVGLWEPFLTNKVLFHDEHTGELTGEWISTEKWESDGRPDMLAFLDVDNMYWTGTFMRGIDQYDANYLLEGQWTVDGNKVLIEGNYETYYAIFNVDESGELAKLTFEYSVDDYPVEFSDDAREYVEREPVVIYEQASEMGVFDYSYQPGE